MIDNNSIQNVETFLLSCRTPHTTLTAWNAIRKQLEICDAVVQQNAKYQRELQRFNKENAALGLAILAMGSKK
jgi:hypothetical protein